VHAKLYYNSNHREVALDEDYWVWLRLLHRPTAFVPAHRTGELDPKFYGPYKLELLGQRYMIFSMLVC
jgi:hypothetical protein